MEVDDRVAILTEIEQGITTFPPTPEQIREGEPQFMDFGVSKYCTRRAQKIVYDMGKGSPLTFKAIYYAAEALILRIQMGKEINWAFIQEFAHKMADDYIPNMYYWMMNEKDADKYIKKSMKSGLFHKLEGMVIDAQFHWYKDIMEDLISRI